jgi:hypothetical protein
MIGRETEDESDDLDDLDDLDIGDPGDDGDAPFDEHYDDLTHSDPGLDEPPAHEEAPAEVPDEDATAVADLDGLDETVEYDPDALFVVDWSTEAALIDFGVRVPAVLDPTREHSILYTRRADLPAALRVAVGPVDRLLTLEVVPDDEEWIRLGRDFLAGAIAVRS